jgi:ferritin-like metal-binding protein YciE
MGLFTTPVKTLDDLFVHTLKDIYYAEHQITKALPKMIERASNPNLRSAFTQHLEETNGQIKRLEQVFSMLDEKPSGVACDAIDGIISEAKQVMSDVVDGPVMDAALASCAQAVEHYEISRYGTLIALAKQVGRANAVGPLKATLEEEKATDRKLTELAESQVNRQAA